MWQAFKDAGLEAIGSKKFIVFVGSLIAWALMKLHLNVSQDTIDRYLLIAASYLVAQGVADHGKGAAMVNAKLQMRMMASRPLVSATKEPEKGSARVVVMLATSFISVLAFVALVFGPACGAGTVGATLTAGQCVLDTGILNTVVTDLGKDDYATLIADLYAKGPAVVVCALQAVATARGTTSAGVWGGSAGSAALTTSQPTVEVVRARELLAKYGAK